jgi:hypothetical protein
VDLISQYFRNLLWREAAKLKGLKTAQQLADLQERCNALLCLIQNWRVVQLVYTPHVASFISLSPPENGVELASLSPDTLAENIPLYLPSSLPCHIHCLPELREICQLEQRLCEPQADDALNEVRHQQRVIQGLWQFKQLNISGTGNKPNTRMITLYKRFSNKTNRAVEKYKSAWCALCALDPGGSWLTRLKELKKEHVSGPGKEPDDVSNSCYEPSWIWLVPRISGPSNMQMNIGEEEFNNGMQVEWERARAWMQRWKEELLLVQEEMRRVIAYLKWKADWWREQGALRSPVDVTVLSGVSGYAHKQAVAERCAVHWLLHLRVKDITPTWASDYKHLLHQAVDSAPVVDPDGVTLYLTMMILKGVRV